MKARSSDPDSRVYRLLNRIFLVILFTVMVYSLVFSPEKNRHLLPSGSEWLTGKPSVSTGLSRSFSAAVRFDFAGAKAYNPYGPGVFLFFTIQILMRLAALLIIPRLPSKNLALVIWIDIGLSVVLFLFTFRPFFSGLLKSLSNS